MEERIHSALWRVSIEDVRKLSGIWCSPISIAFDVGANIGQTAHQLLDIFETAHVHAFEPHPRTFKTLVEQIDDSRLEAHQLALGSKEGIANLYVYDNDSLNSLSPNARYVLRQGFKASEVQVMTTTVDLFCERNGIEQIDILKIDTEGFELSVLEGSSSMLSNGNIRFVYLEYNSLFEKPGSAGGALLPIGELLSSFGFHLLTTYTDHIHTDGELFVGANALFAKPPC